MTETSTPAPSITLSALVDHRHLDYTGHMIAGYVVTNVTVDGDLIVPAFPCECGRWVEVIIGD